MALALCLRKLTCKRLSKLSYLMLVASGLVLVIMYLNYPWLTKTGRGRLENPKLQLSVEVANSAGETKTAVRAVQDPATSKVQSDALTGNKETPEKSALQVRQDPATPAPIASISAYRITTGVSGKLGNQMFQYASLLGIAYRNNMTPFYTSPSFQSTFHVTHIHTWPSRGFQVVNEKDFASYDPTFEHLQPENTVIMQYFQSWKYFHFMRDTIKKEFTFRERIQADVQRILSRHSTTIGNRTRVGIHIRQGDMNLFVHIRKGYHTAPASYIHKAMDYMRQKHPDVIFLVVTDEPRWTRNNLNASDYILVDQAAAEVHMALLASCDHVIITVGTYGWWGGYLSGGEVVYYWDPAQLLHNPPLPVEIKHPEDFYPPDWVALTGL
ncbi:galactoside alpha-(1,2)-fucosyltransferase 2-like [Babylonia areolata]|uniref:galactoside alpha-(1,2)-fucosyltransferase 2-like n=1 Tax=Babylonia areolata TaxID=304850 RepID=UPI003FD4A15D